ncbi:hypothetical protein GPECTOR_6g544 [Gonium pectorale]|uniref:Uncharacterized protein n=1 Tax=Gonium pectorale TaxID=33097 RepID=A0A150GUS2_GONPE|nr:hypothetical protein GPECTOR_6g544 [Gonium pectorale]|eukprot:KXZ53627.1 hypothetical protein GPECTOR_6g544 [Gonium pectorale]
MHERLVEQAKQGVTVRKESWEKLFGHMRGTRQAQLALELMLADAAAREAAGWDWATHGYGQTAFQLVQAAAECGAPEVAEQLLERREELHLTLNKDLVPTLMRKVAAAMTPAGGRDADMDEQVEVVQRLYDKEAALRDTNSPEAAYELSRVLRRAENVGGVRALHSQIVKEGLPVRDGLVEDMVRWLAKRGVRV